MTRFTTLFVSGALLASVGCKDRTDQASKAADRATREEQKFSKDVDQKVDKTVQGARDLAHEAGDVNAAQTDFTAKRDNRVSILRAHHSIDVANLTALKTLASVAPLTDRGRADVGERIATAELRLDEAGRMIQDMPTVTADDWKAKDDAVSDAMTRLRDSIDDGFTALRDAPRLPATAS